MGDERYIIRFSFYYYYFLISTSIVLLLLSALITFNDGALYLNGAAGIIINKKI